MTARAAGRIVVVGAGVTGLAAALRVRERAPEREVVVLEASDRVGGALFTETVDGLVVEAGAESMLSEKPWGVALVERLGIASRFVSPAEGQRRTYVVRNGRLLPLPEGFLLLAPTRPWPVLASGIFSPAGKLRLGAEVVLPRGPEAEDESLASFTRRRFGTEALERVVDPLVGGIYTADPERLSIRATLPRFPDLERSHRSVILGLRATATRDTRNAAGARYGLFTTHERGMGAFAHELATRLPEGSVRLGARVDRLARTASGWRVDTDAEGIDAAAVVVATPAFHAAAMLAVVDADLARLLSEIEYASAATITLVYRKPDVPADLPGFGFVVPHQEGHDLIACTFLSRKYPFRTPDGLEVIRAFVGGARRPEMSALADDELLPRVRADLAALAGIRAEPTLVRVHRWARAMPQYVVGHLRRVTAIEERADRLPGLRLAGAAYRGVGIPDCIRSGEAAADALVEAA